MNRMALGSHAKVVVAAWVLEEFSEEDLQLVKEEEPDGRVRSHCTVAGTEEHRSKRRRCLMYTYNKQQRQLCTIVIEPEYRCVPLNVRAYAFALVFCIFLVCECIIIITPYIQLAMDTIKRAGDKATPTVSQ